MKRKKRKYYNEGMQRSLASGSTHSFFESTQLSDFAQGHEDGVTINKWRDKHEEKREEL